MSRTRSPHEAELHHVAEVSGRQAPAHSRANTPRLCLVRPSRDRVTGCAPTRPCVLLPGAGRHRARPVGVGMAEDRRGLIGAGTGVDVEEVSIDHSTSGRSGHVELLVDPAAVLTTAQRLAGQGGLSSRTQAGPFCGIPEFCPVLTFRSVPRRSGAEPYPGDVGTVRSAPLRLFRRRPVRPPPARGSGVPPARSGTTPAVPCVRW